MTTAVVVLLTVSGAIVALVALLLFALWARGSFARRIRYRVEHVPPPEAPEFPFVVTSLSNSLCTQGRAEGFWSVPDEIFASRLELVRAATRWIYFETFVMTGGRRAAAFCDALAERARAGVRVQVVLDAAGSHALPRACRERLERAGVEVRRFGTFDLRAPLEYLCRTHRKVLIVDGEVAQIGGTGVADLWDGKPEIGDTEPWLDVEVRVRGPIVGAIAGVSLQQWTDTGGTADLSVRPFVSAKAPPSPRDRGAVVTAGDGPSYRDSALRALFGASIAAARRRVWLVSPYFLPDRDLRTELVRARARGVDVRVLTTGPVSDVRPVYFVSRELYRPLLAHGVKIYEYQPAMMHAKLLLCDDDWCMVGSANVDAMSFFHNEELNVSLTDPGLVREAERFVLAALTRSELITMEGWQQRPARERVLGSVLGVFQRHM